MFIEGLVSGEIQKVTSETKIPGDLHPEWFGRLSNGTVVWLEPIGNRLKSVCTSENSCFTYMAWKINSNLTKLLLGHLTATGAVDSQETNFIDHVANAVGSVFPVDMSGVTSLSPSYSLTSVWGCFFLMLLQDATEFLKDCTSGIFSTKLTDTTEFLKDCASAIFYPDYAGLGEIY